MFRVITWFLRCNGSSCSGLHSQQGSHGTWELQSFCGFNFCLVWWDARSGLSVAEGRSTPLGPVTGVTCDGSGSIGFSREKVFLTVITCSSP